MCCVDRLSLQKTFDPTDAVLHTFEAVSLKSWPASGWYFQLDTKLLSGYLMFQNSKCLIKELNFEQETLSK
tara:strand:- start:98 stop:310 length:213 start_codon:yes stop_codon:yes gene_type:complete